MSSLVPLPIRNTLRLINNEYDQLGDKANQFVREYFENSRLAILRSNVGNYIGWRSISYNSVPKLAIFDNGPGMSKDDLEQHLGLSSSAIDEDEFAKNWGMGAKISAIPRNHRGILFYSKHKNQLNAACIAVDKNEVFLDLDAKTDYAPPFPYESGTGVVFLGMNEIDDTTQGRDISLYLTKRYLQLPSRITCQAHNVDIKPYNYYLNTWAAHSGTITLSGAVVQWWLVTDERHSGTLHPTTAILLVQDGEVYEWINRPSLLGKFGISNLDNNAKVILAIIPVNATPDIGRSRLLLKTDEGAKQPPLDDWAREFADKCPDEIAKLRQTQTAKSFTLSDILAELQAKLPIVPKGVHIKPNKAKRVLIDDSKIWTTTVGEATITVQALGNELGEKSKRQGSKQISKGTGRRRIDAKIVDNNSEHEQSGKVRWRKTPDAIAPPLVFFKHSSEITGIGVNFARCDIIPNVCYVNIDHRNYHVLARRARAEAHRQQFSRPAKTILQEIVTQQLQSAVIHLRTLKTQSELDIFFADDNNFDVLACTTISAIAKALETISPQD